MKEIKFRAWDSKQKKMYKSDIIMYGKSYSMDLLDMKDEETSVKFENESDIIMQYTGLKDKNGKEIYEGDIVSNPRYEETYIVEYHIDGYVGWGDDRVCGCYLITDDDIEVIGNIHENPELIK